MKKTLTTLLLIISNLTLCQSQHLVPFRKGNKWGYSRLSKPNELIIKPEYEEASWFSGANRLFVGRVKKNGKYGFIDYRNRIVIPFIYNDVQPFVSHRARIKVNGKGSTTICVGLLSLLKNDDRVIFREIIKFWIRMVSRTNRI